MSENSRLYDYLIVGSGLYGAVFAYLARRRGRRRCVLGLSLLLMLAALPVYGQEYRLDWDVSLSAAGATTGALPFWAVTGKNGIVPSTHSAFAVAGTDFTYSSRPGVEVYAGFKLSGSTVPAAFSAVGAAPAIRGYEAAGPASRTWRGAVNELYAGVGWKMLRLDLGMIDRETGYGGLSLTGGNIVWSGNTRSAPGYNLQVDWVEIPGTRGIFALKANYADYKMLDDRYVDGPLLHNKSLFARFRLHSRVHLTLGLEQWSMWGGTSPRNGKQPQSFSDYVRVVCGMSGGEDATLSDQINVLGDHRGRELIQVDWAADRFTLTFAHDIPFDDGSGMGFQNFPDGVNTLCLAFNDKDRWVNEILYEFVFTKCQSGSRHDRPAKPDELERDPDKKTYIIGGNDNYFNNGEYRSGWTYYGRTAGLPLFTPMPADADGLVTGICNNRVVAHHIGIGGKFARRIPYRFKATYSRNYGQYSQRMDLFDSVPEQLSLALEVDFPRFSRKFPVSVSVGAYGDVGELYQDSFGLVLRLSYAGRLAGGR